MQIALSVKPPGGGRGGGGPHLRWTAPSARREGPPSPEMGRSGARGGGSEAATLPPSPWVKWSVGGPPAEGGRPIQTQVVLVAHVHRTFGTSYIVQHDMYMYMCMYM